MRLSVPLALRKVVLCSDPWRVCCFWSVYHKKTLDICWLRKRHCVIYSLRDWLNFTASYPHHWTLQTFTATPAHSGGVFAMKRWSVYTHFICGHASYLPIVNIHPEDVLLVLQGSVHTGQYGGEPVVSWQWERPQVLLLFGLLQWAHQGSTKGLTKSLFCVDHLCAFVLVWKMSWIKLTLLSVRHYFQFSKIANRTLGV